MDEIARAVEHGWTWHAGSEAVIGADPHERVVDLGSEGGTGYQKVTRGGIVIAFVRLQSDGTSEVLLPPATMGLSGDDDEE